MKLIRDLTEQEILNLTDEQVRDLCISEHIVRGVRIPIAPKKPEIKEIDQPNSICYYIEALPNYLFTTMNDAKKVYDAIMAVKPNMRSLEYKYFGDNVFRYPDTIIDGTYRESALSISTIKCYKSFDDVDKFANDAKENYEKQKDYKAEMEVYNREKEESDKINSIVLSRINEVRSKYNAYNAHLDVFKTLYIPVSDSKEEAMKFFKLAYKIDKEEEDYILDNLDNMSNE